MIYRIKLELQTIPIKSRKAFVMKKSHIILTLLLVFSLALSACGSSSNAVAPKSETINSDAKDPSSVSASISDNTSEEGSSATNTGNSDTPIADLLVMENNESLINAPGSIMFSTPSSIDDTIAFYKEVLATLNAKGEESRDTTAALDTWTWSGNYDNGTLDILVTSNSNGAGVAISYT